MSFPLVVHAGPAGTYASLWSSYFKPFDCYGRNKYYKTVSSRNWLLLLYKVPPEPAKKRIALWRKLKGMGAVYLQDGVCFLPKTKDHLRGLRILDNEITEIGGEAVVLESHALDRAQEERVVKRFNVDRNEIYKEFLGRCADYDAEIAREIKEKHFTYAELEENDEDLRKLRDWLAKIKRLDFYDAPLAKAAQDKLQVCAALLEDFSHKVFAAQDEMTATRAKSAQSSDSERKARRRTN
jgi:hypothetical protein